MEYRYIYTDQTGVQWYVTDYGNVRMDLHHRRQAERRRLLAVGVGLIMLDLALICLIGYTLWGVGRG